MKSSVSIIKKSNMLKWAFFRIVMVFVYYCLLHCFCHRKPLISQSISTSVKDGMRITQNEFFFNVVQLTFLKIFWQTLDIFTFWLYLEWLTPQHFWLTTKSTLTYLLVRVSQSQVKNHMSLHMTMIKDDKPVRQNWLIC